MKKTYSFLIGILVLFIINTASPNDWRVNADNTLWATEASANNPCPLGFRVPSDTEYSTLVTAASITNSATAASSALKFSNAGYRDIDGILYVGSLYSTNYWISTPISTGTSARAFSSSSTYTGYYYARAFGGAVRCIKN